MPSCLNPQLFRTDPSGRRAPRKGSGTVFYGGCGKCELCLASAASMRGTRLFHELLLADAVSSHVTLTFDDEHLPPGWNADPSLVRSFLKLLRVRVARSGGAPFRFYCQPEYSPRADLGRRPHFHLVLIGYFPSDAVAEGRPRPGRIYRSALLDSLWGRGLVCVQRAEGIGIATYVTVHTISKSEDGTPAGRIPPKPFFSKGLGRVYADRHALAAVRLGSVRLPGYDARVPRYYRDRIKPEAPLEVLKYNLRQAEEAKRPSAVEASAPERLKARAEIKRAKGAMRRRADH